MKAVSFNHQIHPYHTIAISPFTSSTYYGIGCFETMKYTSQHIPLLALHWDRMLSTIEILKLQFQTPYSIALLNQDIQHLLEHLCLLNETCKIRLTILSQSFTSQLHYSPIDLLITAEKTQWLSYFQTPIHVGICKKVKKQSDLLSRYKTNQFLIYQWAHQYASSYKWDDALIINEHQRIVESTMANVFIIYKGKCITPPLSEGCIDGIMRKHLLSLNIDIIEEVITENMLLQCDEIFLTNALRGIIPIQSIEGKTLHIYKSKEISNYMPSVLV